MELQHSYGEDSVSAGLPASCVPRSGPGQKQWSLVPRPGPSPDYQRVPSVSLNRENGGKLNFPAAWPGGDVTSQCVSTWSLAELVTDS
jgi:hypothetical protein